MADISTEDLKKEIHAILKNADLSRLFILLYKFVSLAEINMFCIIDCILRCDYCKKGPRTSGKEAELLVAYAQKRV